MWLLNIKEYIETWICYKWKEKNTEGYTEWLNLGKNMYDYEQTMKKEGLNSETEIGFSRPSQIYWSKALL